MALELEKVMFKRTGSFVCANLSSLYSAYLVDYTFCYRMFCSLLRSMLRQKSVGRGPKRDDRAVIVILLLLCRHKFAEYTYLRAADKKKGIAEHLEKSVIFLVEGEPLAQPDASAADSLAKAAAAETEEAAAKEALDAAAEAAKTAEKVGARKCFPNLGLACIRPLKR